MCSVLLVNAQRYDNTWLWGIYPQNQNNAQYPYHGNAHGTFDNDTFVTQAKFRGMTFSEHNNCISDPGTGDLLFYTNGLCVRGSNDLIIENGDSLGYPDWFPENGGFGKAGAWCLLTLPVPMHDSSYMLIYNRYDSSRFASMCYSKLEITHTNLKLRTKDVKFSLMNPAYGGLAASKHGNGRDWWVIFIEANTNCFHKYLLTKDTFELHSIQCIGRPIDIADACKSVFSPDGSKLLRTACYGASDVFDFDRCSGLLYNYLPLDTFHGIDTTSGALSDCITSGNFSDNSRFIYLNGAWFIFQYDLWASDVNASKDTVGATDFWVDTVTHRTGPYAFYLSQYGPDGKIYIGPGTGKRFFTTIENPNGKGDSCQFKLRSVQVTKWIDLTIPYSPNYRLGRLPGSACDTIYNDIKPLYTRTPWLKVYPNPSTDVVRFEYNWVDWDALGECQLVLADLQGRVVLSQIIPKYSSRQEVNIKELAAGVYTASVQSGEKRIAVCKVLRE